VIENRNVLAGTRLVANYKKQRYVCTVEAGEGDEGIAFVLEDGKRFKSPSAAGSHIMGGKAVNGWRFWSLEGEEPKPADGAEPKAAATKTAKASKKRKAIYKIPNQHGTPVGKQKFFCTACMKGFLVDEGETPEVCPEGHRNDDPDSSAPAGEAATSVEDE
jgi:hypothetical protein